MIGVIGVGGAGGNVADIATKYGFQTAAINFSERDLSSLEHVKNRLKLSGSEGVGKNRQLAIELFQRHYEKAINFIDETFSSSKLLIFPFATGGGSGAGTTPILIDVLTQAMPDKIIIAMPILPDTTEAIINQENTLQVFEELSSLDVAIIPVDNERARMSNISSGKGDMFKTINNNAIKHLHKVYKYTQYESKNGNYDERDFLATVNIKGVCIIGEATINKKDNTLNLSGDAIPQLIQKSWSDNIYAPIEFNKVIKAGFIFDGKEEYMKELELPKIFNKFSSGMPIEMFEGYYHESEECSFITILSGLSLPKSRLQEIEQIIQQSESKIEKIVNDNYEYKAKSPILTSRIRKNVQVESNNKKSTSSIFSKYNKR